MHEGASRRGIIFYPVDLEGQKAGRGLGINDVRHRPAVNPRAQG